MADPNGPARRRDDGDQPIDLSDMRRLEARVTGNVQEVGYRDFVRETARLLGISGWVRNEPDGTVRFAAEATPEALDELEMHLRKGPEGAGVRAVEQREFSDARGLPEPFEVRGD